MQEAAFVNDFCYRKRPYSTEKCGHNAVSIPADSVSPQSAAGNVQQGAYRYGWILEPIQVIKLWIIGQQLRNSFTRGKISGNFRSRQTWPNNNREAQLIAINRN